jgi:hypothetical protein
VPTFADRGCQVVSATDPHGRIFDFLGQELPTRCNKFGIEQATVNSLLLHHQACGHDAQPPASYSKDVEFES